MPETQRAVAEGGSDESDAVTIDASIGESVAATPYARDRIEAAKMLFNDSDLDGRRPAARSDLSNVANVVNSLGEGGEVGEVSASAKSPASDVGAVAGRVESGETPSPLSPYDSSSLRGESSSASAPTSSEKQRRRRSIGSGSNAPPPLFTYLGRDADGGTHFSLVAQPASPSVPSSSSPSPFEKHGTTLWLLLAIHALYFYQWNRRTPKSRAAVSYRQLAIEGRFYRLVPALLSHPPPEGAERDEDSVAVALSRSESGGVGDDAQGGTAASSEGDIETRHPSGNADAAERTSGSGGNTGGGEGSSRPRLGVIVGLYCADFLGTARFVLRAIRRVFRPVVGPFAGWPLLAYVSHVLWQCRSLEELYDGPGRGALSVVLAEGADAADIEGAADFVVPASVAAATDGALTEQRAAGGGAAESYLRVLAVLASVAVLLELNLLRSAVRQREAMEARFGRENDPSRRTICTLTSLAAAILVVYDSHFPHAPPPVMPFVSPRAGSTVGEVARFNLFLCVVVLAILSHRIHPTSSVLSGLASGSLWSIGVTSFLGTRYWGNVALFAYGVACLLSLKAHPRHSRWVGKFVPCLDYVAWDRRGDIPDGNSTGGRHAMAANPRAGFGRRASGAGGGNSDGGLSGDTGGATPFHLD